MVMTTRARNALKISISFNTVYLKKSNVTYSSDFIIFL